MSGKLLPISSTEVEDRLSRAAGPTSDDVSLTRDGRRLDSKEAVIDWLSKVNAERAAGRFVELDER